MNLHLIAEIFKFDSYKLQKLFLYKFKISIEFLYDTISIKRWVKVPNDSKRLFLLVQIGSVAISAIKKPNLSRHHNRSLQLGASLKIKTPVFKGINVIT